MEREQIIKALELHSQGAVSCLHECPYGTLRNCGSAMARDALSLIKELTEENERLRAERDTFEIYYKDYKYKNKELTAFNRRWAKECAELQEECDQIKANTVRKMLEMVKRRASTVGNSYANGETVIIQYCVSPQALDQIAKEMLEEGK